MFVEVVLTAMRDRADAFGRDHAEALSDALLEAGALSATIEDADAGSAEEEPLFGEPGAEHATAAWNRSRVVALFDQHADIDAALAEALLAAGIRAPIDQARRDVADANWVGLTQSQFVPIAIGRRLWIVPSWHALPDAAKKSDAIVLKLDPGMAFGTGDHATTRLCLAWLDQHMACGASVIDYGCGSGILAIAAKKLGAGRVVGTDIDDQAVSAARANAMENEVEIAFTPSSRFESEATDVVIANILSTPLKLLAPLLCALVAPGGRLVLSGILERQWREVAEIYAPEIVMNVWRSEDGWVGLVGVHQEPIRE